MWYGEAVHEALLPGPGGEVWWYRDGWRPDVHGRAEQTGCPCRSRGGVVSSGGQYEDEGLALCCGSSLRRVVARGCAACLAAGRTAERLLVPPD